MNTKATYYGMNPPFFGGRQGVLSSQEDERLIKNDVLQLLLTVPGERLMRPLYGTELRRFVFEQFDDGAIIELESNLRSQIELNDPRLVVDSVLIKRDDERHGLIVNISFYVKKDPLKILTIEQFLSSR